MIAVSQQIERHNMTRGRKKELIVTYETIAHCTDFSEDFVRKAVSRGELNESDLGSVAVWLAENGNPHIRAAMARRIGPILLGLIGRSATESDRLMGQMENQDMVLGMFKSHNKPRVKRARGIKEGRSGVSGRPRTES